MPRKRVLTVSVLSLALLTAAVLVVWPALAQDKARPSWMEWGKKYWPTEPVRGGYLRSSAAAYIGLMNPNHWPVNDWVSIGFFYDKLIVTDGEYKPTIPWLAESWEYIDSLTVIMKLRRGVQYHDGSAFNAESLRYQMDWIMDRKNQAWTRAWIAPVKSVEVVDEYTVKWHFKEPWAGFAGIMSNVPGYVLSAEALKKDVALREVKTLASQIRRARKKISKLEERAKAAAAKGGEAAEKARAKLDRAKKRLTQLEEEAKAAAALAKGAKPLDSNPVGAGPYIFEDASPGNYLKVRQNPNWWFKKVSGRPMPYFDGIKISVIPDPSVQLANLRAGKIDVMVIRPSQYPMVKNDRNPSIYVYPQNDVMALRFDLSKGPCKDIRVRKAVSHAIDRRALIAGTIFGLGRPATCTYPNDHWTYNPNLEPVRYDPELSKKLLAEAGFAKGLTLKGFMNNLPEFQTIAEAVKNMLAQVGIEWKVDMLDTSAIAQRLEKVDYDLAHGGWAWIYDPDLMATGLYHPDGGFNFGRSHNEEAIKLIMAGRREVDVAKRKKIYQQLQKVLYDNYEDVWLWWPMTATAYRKNVQGFNLEMFLQNREGYYWSHPMWFKDGKP